MTFPSAKITTHSKAPNGEELITMEVELHRFILPEFNTHRCFSRNFQSSRAVPVGKMIEQVRTSPAIPVHWGENQRGMVAEKESTALVKDDSGKEFDVSDWWKKSAKEAADYATAMNEAGYHKQVVNRILEPFMKTKGVVTATREGFESFFKLRSHKDAQPEIKVLSDRMMEALENSIPKKLNVGDYHLPYIKIPYNGNGMAYIKDKLESCLVHHKNCGSENLLQEHIKNDLSQNSAKGLLKMNNMSIEEAVKVSSSCCAQVSYRTLDSSLEKAIKIYEMLNLPEKGVYPEDPPHFSPTEHIALIMDSGEDWQRWSGNIKKWSGNFNSNAFGQYRKFLEKGSEDIFYLDSEKLLEMITD